MRSLFFSLLNLLKGDEMVIHYYRITKLKQKKLSFDKIIFAQTRSSLF